MDQTIERSQGFRLMESVRRYIKFLEFFSYTFIIHKNTLQAYDTSAIVPL